MSFMKIIGNNATIKKKEVSTWLLICPKAPN